MGHENSIPARRWPAWINATALLVSSWIAIAAVSFQNRADAEIVAVAFPIWWDAHQAVQAAASANATIVRTTAIPSVLIVRTEGGELTRLREAGVWFAADPGSAEGCLTREGEESRR